MQRTYSPTPPASSPVSPVTVEEKIDFTALTKPRVYKIIPPGVDPTLETTIDRPLRFFTLGCADGGVEAMKKVLELMENLARGETYDIILILGDNFNSKDPAAFRAHMAFLTHLHNLFAKHPLLKKIPKFVILGNHDVIDKNGQFHPEWMHAQIQHTFMKLVFDPKTNEMNYVRNSLTNEAELDLEKIKLFMPTSEDATEVVIRYEQLLPFENQWFMPAPYYSLVWGDTAEIICSNTNVLASNYLEHHASPGPADSDQVTFLFDRMQNLFGRTLFFAGHHPMVNANDKRTVEGASDHTVHIKLEEYKRLTELKLAKTQDGKLDSEPKSNHTDILSNMLFHPGDKALGIPKGPGYRVTAYIVAHHHAEDFFNDGQRVQIKAGGAGGPPPLQNRFSHADPQFLPAFLKNNGVVCVHVPAGASPQIMIDLHGIADPEIQFATRNPHVKFFLRNKFLEIQKASALPPDIIDTIMAYEPNNLVSTLVKLPRDEKAEKLAQTIIPACEEYQRHLALNPPPRPVQVPNWWIIPKKFHKKVNDSRGDDVIFVDALLNHFNSYHPIDIETSINYLQTVLIKVGAPSSFLNFYTSYPKWREIFDNALQKAYGVSYDAFTTALDPSALLHGKKEERNTESPTRTLILEPPAVTSKKEEKSPDPKTTPGSILGRLFARSFSPEFKDTSPPKVTLVPAAPPSFTTASFPQLETTDHSIELSDRTTIRSAARAIPAKKTSEATLPRSYSCPQKLEKDFAASGPGSFTIKFFSPLTQDLSAHLQDIDGISHSLHTIPSSPGSSP